MPVLPCCETAARARAHSASAQPTRQFGDARSRHRLADIVLLSFILSSSLLVLLVLLVLLLVVIIIVVIVVLGACSATRHQR